MLSRVPFVTDIYERVQAGLVRAGTGLGNLVVRLTQPEESLSLQFQSCQDQLQHASVRSAQTSGLETEVTELQALLGYVQRTDAVGITAQVIARAVDDDVSQVIIDRGADDGVIDGSAAVIGDGILFGMVDEVRERTSVLRLVSNPTSHIPAAILGRKRTIGLVEGRDGAVLQMGFIPQDAELAVGDLVVTSGLDGLVREGLVIGQTTELVSSDSAPFQSALVELLYEPREWTTVLILPPPGL